MFMELVVSPRAGPVLPQLVDQVEGSLAGWTGQQHPIRAAPSKCTLHWQYPGSPSIREPLQDSVGRGTCHRPVIWGSSCDTVTSGLLTSFDARTRASEDGCFTREVRGPG